MSRLRPLRLPCALAIAGSLFACRRGGDEAGRARLFAAEQPSFAVIEARETLDARRLSDEPALAERVLHMGRAEIAARLGSYRAQSRAQFAWFRGGGAPDGGGVIQLSEESSLAQSSGGDFTVRLANDRNQGYEVVWAKGEVFERSLFGGFHKRRTDRADADRLREQAMSALPTFDRLARGLQLRLAGETRYEGRRAIKYTVAGFGGRPPAKDERELPAIEYPARLEGQDKGPDPDTARRLQVLEKEEPVNASGVLFVDAETAAPLACDLKGLFRMAAAAGGAPGADLHLHAVLASSEVGKDPAIRPPAFEQDPSVPHAVKDPLRFLGRVARPGAPSSEDATEGEEEEEAPQ